MNNPDITKKAIHQVIREYWSQYKKYPRLTTVGFLLPSMGTLLVFFIPPLIVARLIDIFATRQAVSFDGVLPYIILFGSVWLLGESLWRVGMLSMSKLKANAIGNLARSAFRKLTDRDYGFYADNFIGSLTKKGLAFSANFERITDSLYYSVVGNSFTIIFASVILWRYSFWLPLVLLGSMALAIGIALPIIRRRAALVTLRHQTSSKMAGRLSDAIGNIMAVKSFAQEQSEYKTYETHIDAFTSAHRKAADFQNRHLDAVLSPLYVITNVFGLVAALFFVQRLGLQTGAIVVIFSYYSQVSRIFWEINYIYRTLDDSISEAAEFTQLFIDPPGVQDTSTEVLKKGDPSIHFDAVDFGYDSSDEQPGTFLADFNLVIPANQKVGLVGPSGGGKTTITKLILRFIDVQGGSITIGGQNITAVTQNSLRESIAYVPQEPLLFHRSLYENIAYGNEHATEEQVINAAKLAHAHEFISILSQGYQTLVGERGIKLSGGQRQRVAIARALLKNAPILVLDEATSALDSESEKYIQEGLLELMKDKTALVIAHRLSTIKHLDRIIVLDQGKIVQDGTHEELIKKQGLYATLWGHQSGEFLED